MITLSVKCAVTLQTKIQGLLFAKHPYPLLIPTRFGIHTFGMQFPIDVVVLSKQYRIMKVKQKLAPNRLFFWNPTFPFVIELPEGTIQKKHLCVHDYITIRYIDAD